MGMGYSILLHCYVWLHEVVGREVRSLGKEVLPHTIQQVHRDRGGCQKTEKILTLFKKKKIQSTSRGGIDEVKMQ